TQAGVLVGDELCAPAVFAFRAVVEGRVSEEVIGFEVGVLVVGVGIAGADVAVNSVNEKVEAAEAECELLRFLAEERELAAMMGELVALHKHAARTAAGVEHLAFGGFE